MCCGDLGGTCRRYAVRLKCAPKPLASRRGHSHVGRVSTWQRPGVLFLKNLGVFA